MKQYEASINDMQNMRRVRQHIDLGTGVNQVNVLYLACADQSAAAWAMEQLAESHPERVQLLYPSSSSIAAVDALDRLYVHRNDSIMYGRAIFWCDIFGSSTANVETRNYFLARLNENRAALDRSGANVVLALPADQLHAVADAAPDLWSTRSASLVIGPDSKDRRGVAAAVAMIGGGDIDFEPPQATIGARPADFS